MEARFKERFAPRKCFGRGARQSKPLAGCDGVSAAIAHMRDGNWHRALNEGGSVAIGRRRLRSRSADRDSANAGLVHLCKKSGWEAAREGVLQVPGNASAPTQMLALAPAWLFSHFPYGSFFDEFRSCHDAWWSWSKASVTERRLCMPEYRVPAIMVHMAGLRQESWGRRTLMRALGVWQDDADAVAPETWVSSREPEEMASVGRLLVTEGLVNPTSFQTMGEYDHFAGACASRDTSRAPIRRGRSRSWLSYLLPPCACRPPSPPHTRTTVLVYTHTSPRLLTPRHRSALAPGRPPPPTSRRPAAHRLQPALHEEGAAGAPSPWDGGWMRRDAPVCVAALPASYRAVVCWPRLVVGRRLQVDACR